MLNVRHASSPSPTVTGQENVRREGRRKTREHSTSSSTSIPQRDSPQSVVNHYEDNGASMYADTCDKYVCRHLRYSRVARPTPRQSASWSSKEAMYHTVQESPKNVYQALSESEEKLHRLPALRQRRQLLQNAFARSRSSIPWTYTYCHTLLSWTTFGHFAL